MIIYRDETTDHFCQNYSKISGESLEYLASIPLPTLKYSIWSKISHGICSMYTELVELSTLRSFYFESNCSTIFCVFLQECPSYEGLSFATEFTVHTGTCKTDLFHTWDVRLLLLFRYEKRKTASSAMYPPSSFANVLKNENRSHGFQVSPAGTSQPKTNKSLARVTGGNVVPSQRLGRHLHGGSMHAFCLLAVLRYKFSELSSIIIIQIM